MWAVILAALTLVTSAAADPLPYVLPPGNVPLQGCVEGRALRMINGVPGCAPSSEPPTLTACGTGTIDTSATDFVGTVTLPAGLTSCTINFSKAYTAPPLICFLAAQTQSLGLTIGSAVTSNSGAVSTLTVPFGASLAGAKFGYICGPG